MFDTRTFIAGLIFGAALMAILIRIALRSKFDPKQPESDDDAE